MHYYQHHIGDFIKATARLTDSQSMTYLRMIWRYYDSERPLPNNPKVLAFQLGTSQEDVELLLASFFTLADDGWHQSRCDQEIADYHAFREKKANAGRASAERRRSTSPTDVEQTLNSSSTSVQLTTNQQPLSINHNPRKKAAVAAPDGVSLPVWEGFLAIRKARRSPLTEAALEGIRKQADLAGWSLEKALAECNARGWQSFKAEWVTQKTTPSASSRTRKVFNPVRAA